MPQCLILDTLDGWSMVLVIKPASGAATCFYGAVCNLIWPPVVRRWFHFVFGVWRTFGYSKIFASCGVEHARTRELSLSFPMTQCLIFDTLDGWSMVFLSGLPASWHFNLLLWCIRVEHARTRELSQPIRFFGWVHFSHYSPSSCIIWSFLTESLKLPNHCTMAKFHWEA